MTSTEQTVETGESSSNVTQVVESNTASAAANSTSNTTVAEVQEQNPQLPQAAQSSHQHFIVEGCTYYASLMNGTYRDIGTIVNGKPVFQQIENSNMFIYFMCNGLGYSLDDEGQVESTKYAEYTQADKQRLALQGKAYEGWVGTWAHSFHRKSRAAYMRCMGNVSNMPCDISNGNWQQLHATRGQEHPHTEGTWDNPRSWQGDAPPCFKQSKAISVKPATAEQISAAAATRSKFLEKLASKTWHRDSFFMHQDYRVCGSRARNSPWKPIPGMLKGKRPVYVRNKALKFKEYYNCSYDKTEQRWVLWYGDAFAYSLRGSNALFPGDVKEWEYDDGHYAFWSLSDMQVVKVVPEDEETAKGTNNDNTEQTSSNV
jgi:hypothetical protein